MDEGFNVCHEEIVLHQHPFIKYQALDIKKIHSPLLLSTSKTHTQNFYSNTQTNIKLFIASVIKGLNKDNKYFST